MRVSNEDEYPIRFTQSNTKTISSRAPCHKFNLIHEPTYDEFDNDNIIGEVTNDAQDCVDNQASKGVYNSKTLIAEPTFYVEDYDNFIDNEAAIDETTLDEATDDDFDI
nr:hypothetical protein [Tanacetum cinerariifolium]GFA71408.1 hypothetical protein [Tanacetum cinerariifolium]